MTDSDNDDGQRSGGALVGAAGCRSQRKRDAVLRLLRGEDLETLSRALGVTAATLSGWRDTFLSAGEACQRASKSPRLWALNIPRLSGCGLPRRSSASPVSAAARVAWAGRQTAAGG